AEGLVELLADTPGVLSGRRVVILRAVEGGVTLPNGLTRAGAAARLIFAYRTAIMEGAARELAERLQKWPADDPDAIIVTSGMPLIALTGRLSKEHRTRVPIVAIGPVTAEMAGTLGFRVAAVAEQPTPAALASAIERYFSPR
ncbi:MAG TPA: uroporphyrinogen-III synthase, partial [Candidatus Eisenbacteria bacterium]